MEKITVGSGRKLMMIMLLKIGHRRQITLILALLSGINNHNLRRLQRTCFLQTAAGGSHQKPPSQPSRVKLLHAATKYACENFNSILS